MQQGSGGSDNSDLYFSVDLQDNVTPTADQIEKRLKDLGATKAEIKMFLTAYDQATPKIKAAQEAMKKLPKDHMINIQANADQAHKKIDDVKKLVASPITLTIKVKDDIDQYMNKFKQRAGQIEFGLKNSLRNTPLFAGLLGATSQAYNFVSTPLSNATGLPFSSLGVGAAGLGGAGAIGAFFTKSFQANASLEQQMAQLNQILRTPSQAQASYQQVVQTAQHTPFNQPDVLQSYIQMAQMGINPKNPAYGIKSAANLAAGAQVPISQATGALQNASLGYFESFNNLTGRNIRQTDFTYGGKYSGETYQQAVISVLKQYQNASETQMHTFKGLMTNIQDVITQKLVLPAGQPVFGAIKGLEQQGAGALQGNKLQSQLGDTVDRIQQGLYKVFQLVQQGASYFKTSLETPLKQITHNVVEFGAVFAKAFGGTALTAVKYLGQAFTTILTPVTKLVASIPLLGQAMGTMKALHMMGITMNTGIGNVLGGIAHLNPFQVMHGIGQGTSTLAKLGIYFTVKSIMEMKGANDQLNSSFKGLGDAGGSALHSLKVSFDEAYFSAARFGASVAQAKQWGAEVGQVVGVGTGGPGTKQARAQRLATSEMEGSKVVQQLSAAMGMNMGPLFSQALTARNASGQIQQEHGVNIHKFMQDTGNQLYQNAEDVSKALGVDLKTAAQDTATALHMFNKQLVSAGAYNTKGAGFAAKLEGLLQQPGALTAKDIKAFGTADPQSIVTRLLQGYYAPSIPELQTALKHGSLYKDWQFNTETGPGGHMGLVRPNAGRAGDISSILSGYQRIAASSQTAQSNLMGTLGSAGAFLGIHLPQFPNVLTEKGSYGLGNQVGNLASMSQTQIGNLNPRQTAQAMVQTNNALNQQQRAVANVNQSITKYNDQLSQLQIANEEAGASVAKIQLKMQPLQVVVDHLSLKLSQLQANIGDGLSRAVAAVAQKMTDFEQNSVLPVQHATDIWNQTMLLTSNRLEDVSFSMQKAQYNMDKYNQGMLLGENALTANIEKMSIYNEKLNELQLLNMGLQSDVTRYQVHQGFTSTVMPLMGFSLQREIQLGQERQQLKQDQYDTTYGYQHWQLQRAARTRFQRQEMSFAERMAGTKAAAGTESRGIVETMALQIQQYNEQLHSRKLEQQMYALQLQEWPLQRESYARNRQMYEFQMKTSKMSEQLAKDTNKIQAKLLPYLEAQTVVNLKSQIAQVGIDVNLIVLNETLGNLQTSIADLHRIQGDLNANFDKSIKKGVDPLVSHMQNIAGLIHTSNHFLQLLSQAGGHPGGANISHEPKMPTPGLGSSIKNILGSLLNVPQNIVGAYTFGSDLLGGGVPGALAGVGLAGGAALTYANIARYGSTYAMGGVGAIMRHRRGSLGARVAAYNKLKESGMAPGEIPGYMSEHTDFKPPSAFQRARIGLYEHSPFLKAGLGDWFIRNLKQVPLLNPDPNAGILSRILKSPLLHPTSLLTQRGADFGIKAAGTMVGHVVAGPFGALLGNLASTFMGDAVTQDMGQRPFRFFNMTRHLGARFIRPRLDQLRGMSPEEIRARRPVGMFRAGWSAIRSEFASKAGEAQTAAQAAQRVVQDEGYWPKFKTTMGAVWSTVSPLKVVAIAGSRSNVGGADAAALHDASSIATPADTSLGKSAQLSLLPTDTTVAPESTANKGVLDRIKGAIVDGVGQFKQNVTQEYLNNKAAQAQMQLNLDGETQNVRDTATNIAKQTKATSIAENAAGLEQKSSTAMEQVSAHQKQIAYISNEAAKLQHESTGTFRKVTGFFGDHAKALGRTVGRFSGIVGFFSLLPAEWQKKIENFAGGVSDFIKHGVKSFVGGAADFIKNGVKAFTGSVGNLIKNGFDEFKNVIKDVFKPAVALFKSIAGGLIEWIKKIPGVHVAPTVTKAAIEADKAASTFAREESTNSAFKKAMGTFVEHGGEFVKYAGKVLKFAGWAGGAASFVPAIMDAAHGKWAAAGGQIANAASYFFPATGPAQIASSIQELLTGHPASTRTAIGAFNYATSHPGQVIPQYAPGGGIGLNVGGNQGPGPATVVPKIITTQLSGGYKITQTGVGGGMTLTGPGGLNVDIQSVKDAYKILQQYGALSLKERANFNAAYSQQQKAFYQAALQGPNGIKRFLDETSRLSTTALDLDLTTRQLNLSQIDTIYKEFYHLSGSQQSKFLQAYQKNHTAALTAMLQGPGSLQEFLNAYTKGSGSFHNEILKLGATSFTNQIKTTNSGFQGIGSNTTTWLNALTKQISDWENKNGLNITGKGKVGEVVGGASKSIAAIAVSAGDVGSFVTSIGSGTVPTFSPFAAGGIVQADPHKVGPGRVVRMVEEGHPEIVIPLAPHRRDRARSLVKQAQGLLGGYAAGGYVYPLPGWSIGRTDQGIDATASNAPVLAIGDTRFSYQIPNWYGSESLYQYQLTSGPDRGKFYYVAEQFTPSALSGTWKAGQALGRGSSIEMGWGATLAASLGHGTLADVPPAHYNEGDITPAGLNFAAFISGLAHGKLVMGGPSGGGLGAAMAQVSPIHLNGPPDSLKKMGIIGPNQYNILNKAVKAWQKKLNSQSGGSASFGGKVLGNPNAVSGRFSSVQRAFISTLAALTGLSPRVIGAWVVNEEPAGATSGYQGTQDWLNVGITDSGPMGAGNAVWQSPVSAARATAAWIKGTWSDPGFGTASAGIQAIIKTAHSSPLAQMMAIANSGWASSGYGGGSLLVNSYNQGYSGGLPRVPRDNFPAILHAGETVMSAAETNIHHGHHSKHLHAAIEKLLHGLSTAHHRQQAEHGGPLGLSKHQNHKVVEALHETHKAIHRVEAAIKHHKPHREVMHLLEEARDALKDMNDLQRHSYMVSVFSDINSNSKDIVKALHDSFAAADRRAQHLTNISGLGNQFGSGSVQTSNLVADLVAKLHNIPMKVHGKTHYVSLPELIASANLDSSTIHSDQKDLGAVHQAMAKIKDHHSKQYIKLLYQEHRDDHSINQAREDRTDILDEVKQLKKKFIRQQESQGVSRNVIIQAIRMMSVGDNQGLFTDQQLWNIPSVLLGKAGHFRNPSATPQIPSSGGSSYHHGGTHHHNHYGHNAQHHYHGGTHHHHHGHSSSGHYSHHTSYGEGQHVPKSGAYASPPSPSSAANEHQRYHRILAHVNKWKAVIKQETTSFNELKPYLKPPQIHAYENALRADKAEEHKWAEKLGAFRSRHSSAGGHTGAHAAGDVTYSAIKLSHEHARKLQGSIWSGPGGGGDSSIKSDHKNTMWRQLISKWRGETQDHHKRSITHFGKSSNHFTYSHAYWNVHERWMASEQKYEKAAMKYFIAAEKFYPKAEHFFTLSQQWMKKQIDLTHLIKKLEQIDKHVEKVDQHMVTTITQLLKVEKHLLNIEKNSEKTEKDLLRVEDHIATIQKHIEKLLVHSLKAEKHFIDALKHFGGSAVHHSGMKQHNAEDNAFYKKQLSLDDESIKQQSRIISCLTDISTQLKNQKPPIVNNNLSVNVTGIAPPPKVTTTKSPPNR